MLFMEALIRGFIGMTDSLEDSGDTPKCNPFGTRYLTDEANVWEHNAWDSVEWTEEMELEAKKVVERQKEDKVEEEKALRLLNEPVKQWDAFYSQHTDNFFKDRNWLLKEFPELDMDNYPQGSTVNVLEVGCGVGNTTFPLLQWDRDRKLRLFSSDYSSVAVNVLKNNANYDPEQITGFVWDITEPPPADGPAESSMDLVVCIYVLSALPPSTMKQAISHLVSRLKPGGILLLKDYGRYDLTQLRFKKDRLVDENLYCRGDGTLVYFFSQQELEALLEEAGLTKNKKALLRLTCETIRFKPVFEAILKEKDLKPILKDLKELDGDKNLAYALLYEFLAGSGLNRVSPKLKAIIVKRGKAIKDYEKILAEEGKGIKSIRALETKDARQEVEIPRYARINTLRWTTEEALNTLQSEQWKIVRLNDKDNFAERVAAMAEDEVIVDPHVHNLLVFRNSPEFHTYWMVEQRYLILQDKASCLPAFLLNPEEGSEVYDTCAAPGMKTSHLAAILNNTGKVWATDRSGERVQTMQTLLDASGVTCAAVSEADFLKADVTKQKYSQVRFALVDPPCSGSGIVKRMDHITGGNCTKDRLAKLQNLQAMILKHALRLPALERVVYSTCSIHEEENEQVVDEVLGATQVRGRWRLKPDVLPSWSHRGLTKYPEVGQFCLRADPKATLTSGFFVAVLERIPCVENEEEY